jgi:hypothetical protein
MVIFTVFVSIIQLIVFLLTQSIKMCAATGQLNIGDINIAPI